MRYRIFTLPGHCKNWKDNMLKWKALFFQRDGHCSVRNNETVSLNRVRRDELLSFLTSSKKERKMALREVGRLLGRPLSAHEGPWRWGELGCCSPPEMWWVGWRTALRGVSRSWVWVPALLLFAVWARVIRVTFLGLFFLTIESRVAVTVPLLQNSYGD